MKKLLKVLWYVVTLYGPVYDAIIGIANGVDKARDDKARDEFIRQRQHFVDVESGVVDDFNKE